MLKFLQRLSAPNWDQMWSGPSKDFGHFFGGGGGGQGLQLGSPHAAEPGFLGMAPDFCGRGNRAMHPTLGRKAWRDPKATRSTCFWGFRVEGREIAGLLSHVRVCPLCWHCWLYLALASCVWKMLCDLLHVGFENAFFARHLRTECANVTARLQAFWGATFTICKEKTPERADTPTEQDEHSRG